MQKIIQILLKLFELWHYAPILGQKLGYLGPVPKKQEFLVNAQYGQYLPSMGFELHAKNHRHNT